MAAATVVARALALEVAQGVHVRRDGHVEVVAAGEHAEEAEHFSFPEANIVQTFRGRRLAATLASPWAI